MITHATLRPAIRQRALAAVKRLSTDHPDLLVPLRKTLVVRLNEAQPTVVQNALVLARRMFEARCFTLPVGLYRPTDVFL